MSSPCAVRSYGLSLSGCSSIFADHTTAPYTAPHREYLSTEQLVKGPLPQFAYQLHLASGDVEKVVKDEQSIRQFLRGLYGARGPNGELAFDPEKGVIAENLKKVGESRILNGEVSVFSYCQTLHKEKVGDYGPSCVWSDGECLRLLLPATGLLTMRQVLEYYVKQYSRHGIHPTCKPRSHFNPIRD